MIFTDIKEELARTGVKVLCREHKNVILEFYFFGRITVEEIQALLLAYKPVYQSWVYMILPDYYYAYYHLQMFGGKDQLVIYPGGDCNAR